MKNVKVILYIHYMEFIDDQRIEDKELIKSFTVIMSEEQINNLGKTCTELLDDSFRLNINQTQLFDPIVTVEILRVPLSEKGNILSTTQSLITKLIGYFNQINNANSVLVKDEKKTREIIARNDGDLVQINPIDFSPEEVKQLEKHLIEEGIDIEILSSQVERIEAGASGGLSTIITLISTLSDTVTVIETIKKILGIDKIDFLSQQDSKKLLVKAAELINVHQDQLAIIYFDTDEENDNRYIIYQNRYMFYGFVFNKKDEITWMMKNENDQEIKREIDIIQRS